MLMRCSPPCLTVPSARFRTSAITPPTHSALGQPNEYNGFTGVERDRTARLSNRLVKLGATIRPKQCDICGAAADDEHAENYYDLARWIGLCQPCHRNVLHKRFTRPAAWAALLDRNELPQEHWARLVAPEPFDIAALLRSRGLREPTIVHFILSAALGQERFSARSSSQGLPGAPGRCDGSAQPTR